jgi:trehalose-phosphatase
VKPVRTNYLFEKDNFKDVFSRLKAKQTLALFLDFDGTLVPIQKDPAQCFLSEEIKRQLRLLANSKHCYLSILSGRSLSDIRKRVGIRKIYYGGNHGLDISGPGIRYTHPKALVAISIMKDVKQQLQKKIKDIEGAWLEDKKFTLSLHFRSVKKNNITLVKKVFYKTVKKGTGFLLATCGNDRGRVFLENKSLTVIKGKKVLELIPGALWDKGRAILWLLQRFKDRCLPIYIGDDQTDETAFKTLKESGITIRVGKSKKTSAKYYLKGSWEISQLLQQMQEFM